MNRRAEETVNKLSYRTRASVKKTTTAKIKKSPKKRNCIYTIRDSSDEEFEHKNPTGRRSICADFQNSLFSKKRLQDSSGSSLKCNHRRSLTATSIYQISDSSDDDDNDIHATPKIASLLEPVNLCDTDDSIMESKDEELNAVIQKVKKERDSPNPSTSIHHAISASTSSHVPDFVNNLLCSNKSFLDENFLKPLKELNEQTDKLLASSWDLINNENGNQSFKESVIYICRDEESPKQQGTSSSEAASLNIDLTKEQEKHQNMKADCPICLEKLASNPVSSTICGHIFCTACIQNCVKSQRKCPTCRKRLTIKMIHPLFLF